jgi:hypothetical protein
MKSLSLILAGVMAAFVVFSPALVLEYWSDDIDHLQEVAGLKVGRVSFARYLFMPHNEHIVPLLRLQDLYITRNWGFEAEPAYRLAILWFGICAALTGLLVLKLTGSFRRGLTATLVFAAAGTMAAMVVTMLTAMMFTQALACYLFALLVDKPWPRIALCAAACLCFPGSFPFAAAVAIASWPRHGWRAAAVWTALAALVLSYHRMAHWTAGSPSKPADLASAHVGLWLPLTAPFRLLWSWTGTVAPPLSVITVGGVLLWAAVFLATRKRMTGTAEWTVAAMLAGAVLQSLLTGVGRAQEFSLLEMFKTDRYYAWFLAPAAVAIACSAPRHWAVAALAGALLVPARLEMNRMVRESLSYISHTPLDHARKLASMVADEIRREPDTPFNVQEQFLRMPGVHKGGMNLSTVIFVSYPDSLPGLRFAPQLSPPEKKRLDDLLYRWRIFRGF